MANKELTDDDNCPCVKIIGHLEDVRWLLRPRCYRPSPNCLALGDWTKDPFIWMHYVESNDGILPDDDVLISTDSRYWSIHDVQRYFFGNMHCENVLFTYQYPNLRMSTRLGSHLWKANTALKLPSTLYQKEFNISFEITLKKMEAEETQMDRFIISDQLIKLHCLDYFKRKTFFRILQNILSFQDRLQLVSLENLCCDRLEGVRLIQQLACFNSDTLKYLFLWRFVLPNQNPILINYSYITGSGQYIPRMKTRHCFLRSLSELRNLRVLALEYSHIADGVGDAILALLPVLKRPHFRLQLICREEQTPGHADVAVGIGGYDIPDTAWKRVAVTCPDLRFLTPSIPMREIHMQFGIDLKRRQRQDSDVNCFVRTIGYQYSSTLVAVSIHQWRFAEFPLRRVLELLPRLVYLSYVGRVKDEVDLRMMLQILAAGVCDKLKRVIIQIQDEESTREYWKKAIDIIKCEFEDVMQLNELNLSLNIYKI